MNKMKLSNKVKIDGFIISDQSPVYVIAEIGTNHHHGDMEIIKKMVSHAKNSGANAVKFQTFKADTLIMKNAPKASRLDELIKPGDTWFDLLKSEELTFQKHKEILEYCKEIDMTFLSTPYDNECLDFLCDEIKVPALKIASADIVNHPLLENSGKKGIPIILSTAMCNINEISDAIKIIISTGNNQIVLLHCTGNYPTKIEDCNLNVLRLYQEKYQCITGYSDHTTSQLVPISAVSLGAKVYEKHFTLSQYMPGADHKTSFDPNQFKIMVQNIRNTEDILGIKEKRVLDSEIENREKYRRCLVAVKDINKNQLITLDMLGIKRPGIGILPNNLSKVNGQRAKTSIKKNTIIKENMLH